MISFALATSAIVWSIETFSSGVMLGIAVYTAARSGRSKKGKK